MKTGAFAVWYYDCIVSGPLLRSADKQRVRDISRLTTERDKARQEVDELRSRQAAEVAAAYEVAALRHCEGCHARLLRQKFVWRYVGKVLTPFVSESGTFGHVSTDGNTVTQCIANDIRNLTPADATAHLDKLVREAGAKARLRLFDQMEQEHLIVHTYPASECVACEWRKEIEKAEREP